MEEVTICPMCGSHHFEPFLSCTDYLVSNEEFKIQQCRQCTFRFTSPRPNADAIGSYYKSDQYISHNDAGKGIVNTAYRIVRNHTLQSKLTLINSLNKGLGSILDVGCGTGAFLETCQRAGWQINGTEPDAEARAVTTRKLQTEIVATLTDIVGIKAYSIITLWHVLEHIPDFNNTMARLHDLLADQGHLLIAVPNSNSYDAQYFKQYWAAYDLPRHLHHFTPSTIKLLINKTGFKLIEQRPMQFDAFYIALLSTHYQSGQTDYLKSMRIGVVSNTKGMRTNNTSSVLYLLKKA